MNILNNLTVGSFDLHIHTTCSDGVFTPTEIVTRAKEVGLTTIAITDHDTLDGVAEAIEAGNNLHIHVIPGVEITTFWEDKNIDILGYNIKDPMVLHQQLSPYRQARVDRAKLIIERFCQLGMPITLDDVLEFSKDGVIARPHIAKAIVQKGYVPSVQEVFDQFLADGKPACVEKKKLTLSEGIQMIHDAEGVAVLAHPVYLGETAVIKRVLQLGLDGIEVWHRNHPPEAVNRFKQLAEQYNLIITGGSDFHTEEHPLGQFIP